MSRFKLILSTSMLLSITALFGESGCPGSVTSVRYHSLDHAQIGIPVAVNQAGPFEFILDTGSQITAIEPSLAAELKLPSLGSVAVLSVIHRDRVPLVRPREIEAGGIVLRGPVIAVLSLAQIQTVHPRVRGILGDDFLERADVLIDYESKRLCLDQNRQMEPLLEGERIPMLAPSEGEAGSGFTHPVLISVHLSDRGGRAAVLQLDSGSSYAILFAHATEVPWWLMAKETREGRLAGNGARVAHAPLPPQTLQIGARMVRKVLFYVPISRTALSGPRRQDGLLPTALFRRVFISYADQCVMFEPR